MAVEARAPCGYCNNNNNNKVILITIKLPEDALGTFPCKPSIFRKRVRSVIKEVK
jgi:hypothetical protein